MTPNPQDIPLTTRLGARLGPEAVATVLVIAVLFVAIAVAVSGQRGSAGVPGSSPEPSVVAVIPSASAELPSPTAVAPTAPPATTSPTATPTPVPSSSTPAVTPRPAQVAAARAVMEIVDRLLDARSDLQAELAKTTTDSNAIADLLRDVNASIVQMDEPLADLAAGQSTANLANRIRAVNAATSETVSRIQHTSPRNAKTYRDGAAEVIEKMEPLPGLRSELAALIN
jgi:hypothetical protein